MKKKILFIIPSLDAGGGEKSLVNLLNVIDFDKYEVDLFLFKSYGLFMHYVPKEVNLLFPSEKYKQFTLPINKSIITLLKNKEIKLLDSRLKFTFRYRNEKNISKREQYNWKYMSKAFDKIPKQYDLAIGFLEKTSIYFCVDKVDAIKKVGFIHTNYKELGIDSEFDRNYFKDLDNIVTVSDECATIIKEKFKEFKGKVKVIKNIVSPSTILKMANEENKEIFERKENEIVLLSIGRLVYLKGFDIAIQACKNLTNKGYKVKWYVIGDGEERLRLEELISKNNLNDVFMFLGLKSNPYPYIKHCDIYVQTSRFEGKSIAIDEAKILNKPIIITNYTTARDQIKDGSTGLIVEMSPVGIANGIEKIINDDILKNKLCTNLSKLKLGTEDEIEKLYKLI